MSTPDTVSKSAPAAPAAKNKPVFIDPEKPFGTIVGDLAEFPQARYTQEGRLFDGDGKLIPNAPVEQKDPRVAILAKERRRKEKIAAERRRARMRDVPGSIALRMSERQEDKDPVSKKTLREIVFAGKRAAGIPVAEVEAED